MRASKRAVGSQRSSTSRNVKRNQRLETRNQKLETADFHISGAEGLFNESELIRITADYLKRALSHPRGRPDTVVLTVEQMHEHPSEAPLLQITTLTCDSPSSAHNIIARAAALHGISKKAVTNALKVLTSGQPMRGASLIGMRSGKRMEPDRSRGVRVSRFGIDAATLKRLSRRLSSHRLNISTVKEALVLASKVAACPGIAAELCISDDPDYTTGYFASRAGGYLRIPNIKTRGAMHGGRIFFVEENADIVSLITYLEKTPVMVKDPG